VVLPDGLSIVVPVFRSEKTLNELVNRITNSISDKSVEIILIDDASGDGTWTTICSIARQNSMVTGIRLGRNSGQHGALLAGVRAAKFQTVVTLDDDLQNPPEEINKLIDALVPGVDVVYGVSTDVIQNFYRRAGSKLVRKFFASALGFNSAVSMSSFRTFRTALREGFNTALGPNVSLDALLTWSTTRFTVVEVKHDERKVGDSHYTFRKLIRFMIDMATGYSALPLRLASALGFLTISFGAVLLVYVIGRPIITGERVQGFPMLASTIIIFSGVQIFLLGILGEYIGRMHFRVMNKPTYMVAETTV
jgi:undecaprenyl-phosphate 4-deoxy-4-formamido-L-arabinose transferase